MSQSATFLGLTRNLKDINKGIHKHVISRESNLITAKTFPEAIIQTRPSPLAPAILSIIRVRSCFA